MINKPQMLEVKPAKQNSLDLEGIDSLFLQSLSAQGLQNIADSQQIHNQITNQNSQTAEGFLLLQDLVRLLQSQSPQRRQDILNQIQNDMNQYIPQEIFNEARALYRNNRDEFMRLLNQPLRQVQQATQQQTNQPRRQRLISQDSIAISIDLQGQAEQSNIVKQEKEESTIRGTRFVQNFHTILQDLNERYEKNQEFLIVESQCDVILHQALLPTEQDTPKQMFNKVKNCVRTALTGFRLLSKELQLIQSVKILHRIPNLRTCLQLNILNMLNEEMQKFKQSIQSQTPYQSQLYTWSTEIQGQEDQMTIQNVVMFCVSTLAQMQESLQEQHGVKTKDIVEPAVKIKSDHLMNKFASFIGKIDQQYSVLESIVNNLSELFELAKQNPQIFGKISKQDQQEFQDRIIEQLCVIIKPILKEIKTKDQKIVFPALKICSLFFTFSLNKKSLVLVRQTLNDMCDSTNQKVLHQFLEQRLSSLLQNAIRQINQKTQFAGLISQITEILKIVNGISRLDQENICDEQQFLEVFKLADQIVQDEQERANHYETGLKHFIYKEEVKQLILLLFSLCEYNLKVIFQSNNTVTTSDSPIKSITPENQIQTLTKENLQSKSEPNTLEEVLKKHQIDSKDQSRFKTLLEFFFSHRKLINNFIKVNQQVINSELKKLVQMIPQILDFDTKRIIWKTELKRLHVKYKNQRFDFSIRRESCFPDSIAELGSLNLKEWRGRFGVEFKGEDGIDEGGLIKEWFSVMSKEMLNEDLALFIKSESGATYYPNPKSTVQPNYQELFTFIGKFVGKALWDQRLLDCYFVKAFYKLILGKPLTYHDLEDYDQELYKSLTWTLENPGAENLCSSFVESQDFFGVQKEIELVEGGLDLAVTDENKWEYVTLVANFRLYKAISTQVDAFLKGFYSVAPRELLKIFDNRELELLISGLQNIDVDDLRENTNYINYTANCKPVQYLWQALQEFENSERAEFIQFVTGSSKVPVEGFKGLRGLNGLAKFTIAKIPTNDQNRLPQSHTCMNQLDLPEYKDKETTKKMVLMAIKEGKMFGIL